MFYRKIHTEKSLKWTVQTFHMIYNNLNKLEGSAAPYGGLLLAPAEGW